MSLKFMNFTFNQINHNIKLNILFHWQQIKNSQAELTIKFIWFDEFLFSQCNWLSFYSTKFFRLSRRSTIPSSSTIPCSSTILPQSRFRTVHYLHIQSECKPICLDKQETLIIRYTNTCPNDEMKFSLHR